MIDVGDYRKRLEARFLAAGFTKLDKPVETEDVLYVAMTPDADGNFDSYFWEPAVQSMLKAMEDVKKFYRLDVYYDDDVLCVTASCGDNPRPRVNN
jgi:hypothetical protein